MFHKPPVIAVEESKDKKTELTESQSLGQLVTAALDFDGSLTSISGGSVIATFLYLSLFEKGQLPPEFVSNPQKYLETHPKFDYDYTKLKFKKHEEVVRLLKEGLALDENKTLKLVPHIKAFLEELYKQNAKILIITRNRADYIRALLEAEGLSTDLIAKIKFSDCYDKGDPATIAKLGDKGTALVKYFEYTPIIIIVDDSPSDYKSLKKALAFLNKQKEFFKMIAGTGEPGQIAFDKIHQSMNAAIEAFLKAQKKPEPPTSSLPIPGSSSS